MFEIGTTLRDARVRRNISLQQAEDDTKIRVKYIQAMENEDFDLLPGDTYAKGFLRTYADYLDIDFQVVLDEFNERFGSGDHREHVLQPPRTAKPKEPHKRQNYFFAAILAVAIIAVLAYLGWGNSSGGKPTLVTPVGATAATTPSAPAATQPPAATPPVTSTAATTATAPSGAFQTIEFRSSKKKNWVGLYRDKAMSDVVWGDTLAPGDSKTLRSADLGQANTLWLDVGSADGLVVSVNGQDQSVTAPGVYKVTPSGINLVQG